MCEEVDGANVKIIQGLPVEPFAFKSDYHRKHRTSAEERLITEYLNLSLFSTWVANGTINREQVIAVLEKTDC